MGEELEGREYRAEEEGRQGPNQEKNKTTHPIYSLPNYYQSLILAFPFHSCMVELLVKEKSPKKFAFNFYQLILHPPTIPNFFVLLLLSPLFLANSGYNLLLTNRHSPLSFHSLSLFL